MIELLGGKLDYRNPSDSNTSEVASKSKSGSSFHVGAVRQDLDALKLYYREIGQHTILTADEEIRLAKQIQEGAAATEALEAIAWLADPRALQLKRLIAAGRRAKEFFVKSNLRLVAHIARKYVGLGLPLLDLIQEGNLGLIRAVEKFDGTKGYRFTTYATSWIQQHISRAIADQGRIVRLPVHVVEKLQALERLKNNFITDYGNEPNPSELADFLDISEFELAELLNQTRPTLSLDELKEPSLGNAAWDVDSLFQPSQTLDEEISLELVQKELEYLLDTQFQPREAAVIRARFGLVNGIQKTLDEIGNEFGVTRERIRQIESKVMSKLRHPSRSQMLKDYLEN